MSNRPGKVHYVAGEHGAERTRCGLGGITTLVPRHVTCRVCWYGMLSDSYPWARGFLDELRVKIAPSRAAEPVNGKVETLGDGHGAALFDDGRSQKLVRKLLADVTAKLATVQEIVDNRGAAAHPVGVEEREVAEHARDAGEVSNGSVRHSDPPEYGVTPD